MPPNKVIARLLVQLEAARTASIRASNPKGGTMNIQVTEANSLQYDINVVIEGECNHADTEIEIEQFDSVSLYGPDSSYEERLEVCTKCGCYKEEYGTEWHGLNVMPN